MKKEICFLLLGFFLISFVSASCDLDVSLLNQDPYPATPGDYVDLVFQIDGVQSKDCGTITFELLEDYPLIFDPGMDSKQTIQGGTYTKGHSSFLMAPFRVRVDRDALDGNNEIEVRYTNSNSPQDSQQTKKFNLNVLDIKGKFEAYVKDYQPTTRELTLQILNIAESDIYTLVAEIPKQENIEVKGANRNIVGDLDANDYTTTTFEAMPQDGKIKINLIYTDEINERRTIEYFVDFDSSYFEGRIADQKPFPVGTTITVVVLLALIAWFIVRRQMKKKKARR